jgi:hypothetical protein
MIRYTTLRYIKLVCFPFSCLLLIFAQPSVAQAAPQDATPTNQQQNCPVLLVELHGSQPPTKTCKQTGKILNPPQGTVRIETTGCGSTALALYADHNFTGWTVCFIGQGFANLDDYCAPLPTGCIYHWNDLASSYSAGCSTGTFYTDKNGNGSFSNFPAYKGGEFPAGNIPDKQLSSLQLDSACR